MRLFCIYWVIALSALFTAGCSTTPSSQHYCLTPLAGENEPPATVNGNTAIRVAVVPVRIPNYIDRPQIVTRIGPNEIKLDEFHRWTGSYRDNITTVIIQNLATLLPDATVFKHPVPASLSADYQVLVDIIQFDGTPGQNVTLEATWGLFQQTDQTRRLLSQQRFQDVVPLAAEGYNALVAAHSRILAKLSRVIARALIASQTHATDSTGADGKTNTQ